MKIALLVLMLTACGQARDDAPTFVYKGVQVYVDATVSTAAHNPNLQAQIEHVIEVSTAYWGTTPEKLSDYQITFTDDKEISCGPWPFKVSHNVVGCTETNILHEQKQIIVSLNGLDWIGESPLPHEVGHTVTFFNDTFHGDDRFRDFASVWDDLTQNCYEDPQTHTQEDSIRWNACQFTHPGWFATWRSEKGDWWDYLPSTPKISLF